MTENESAHLTHLYLKTNVNQLGKYSDISSQIPQNKGKNKRKLTRTWVPRRVGARGGDNNNNSNSNNNKPLQLIRPWGIFWAVQSAGGLERSVSYLDSEDWTAVSTPSFRRTDLKGHKSRDFNNGCSWWSLQSVLHNAWGFVISIRYFCKERG